MSKETGSRDAIDCGCGQRIAFPQFHMSHCSANPTSKAAKIKNAQVAAVVRSATADAVAQSAKQDQKIGRRRKKVKA